MRTALALLAMGMLLLPPSASAAWQDLQAPSNVVMYRTASGDTLLAWSPALGATDYIVYRGAEPGHLAKVHEGATPAFYDTDPLPAGTLVIYVIAAIAADGSSHSTTMTTSSAGDCVAMTTTLSFSIALANCMTMIPEL